MTRVKEKFDSVWRRVPKLNTGQFLYTYLIKIPVTLWIYVFTL